MKDGVYTCRVSFHATSCQPGLNGRQVSVTVDRLAAKVTVLEAWQDDLLNENIKLKNKSAQIAKENQELRDTVASLCVTSL